MGAGQGSDPFYEGTEDEQERKRKKRKSPYRDAQARGALFGPWANLIDKHAERHPDAGHVLPGHVCKPAGWGTEGGSR